MKKTLADLRRHPTVLPLTAVRLMAGLERIEDKPETFNHLRFGSGISDDFDFKNHAVRAGKACCLAGHIVVMFSDHLVSHFVFSMEVELQAMRLLGLGDSSYDDQQHFVRLFGGPDRWPKKFRTNERQITPACIRRRIEHYIETGSMD